MPGFGPGKRLYAVGRQSESDPGMTETRPGQARTHAIAAVPVDRAGMEPAQDALGALLVRGVDAGGEAVLAVVHECDRGLVVVDLLNADDGAEAFVPHHRHALVDMAQHRRL